MSRNVLIVTKSTDNDSVLRVQSMLEARGARALRLDTDLFPTEVRLALRQPIGRSVLKTAAGELALGDIDAVWYRRADTAAALPATLDPQLRAASRQESHATLVGMLESLRCRFIDRYETVRRAAHKPLQLELAREYGLDVPATLTTNDPEAARSFFDVCQGRMIGKLLSSFAIYDEAGRERVMYTTPMQSEHLDHLEDLSFSPMTFQEHLDKALELRVTVIGERVFAAAVDSQVLAHARNDWRRESQRLRGAWEPYALPEAASEGLLRLARGIGLTYGAADIVVTPEGRFVFLEMNPAGEWRWLDDVFGARALSSALADALLA